MAIFSGTGCLPQLVIGTNGRNLPAAADACTASLAETAELTHAPGVVAVCGQIPPGLGMTKCRLRAGLVRFGAEESVD